VFGAVVLLGHFILQEIITVYSDNYAKHVDGCTIGNKYRVMEVIVDFRSS